MGDGLAHGRFFFTDIARDGIVLFEADDRPLPEPKPKTPQQALAMAQEYFEEWFPSAAEFLDNYRFNLTRGRRNNAAFQLHQAAERLYHCVLLASTFYTPHNHNLAFLRIQAERLDIRLVDAWPRSTRAERAMFEKLKDAYVKARYSKHYRISADQLTWLGERVEELGRIVLTICTERIAQLEAIAREAG